MTGEKGFTEKQLDDIIKYLDMFDEKNKLPQIKAPYTEEELYEYLYMSRNEIESLSPTDCGIYNVRIKQICFYLQRIINKSNAIEHWARTSGLQYAATQLGQFEGQYLKYEAKLAILAKTDEHSRKLNYIQNKAKMRTLYYENLVMSLSNIGSALLGIKKNKEYNS